MFKVGDIIRCRYGNSTYRYGGGIYIVKRIINDEEMIIVLKLNSDSEFYFQSNSSADWILDTVYSRRNKIKKICSKLEIK